VSRKRPLGDSVVNPCTAKFLGPRRRGYRGCYGEPIANPAAVWLRLAQNFPVLVAGLLLAGCGGNRLDENLCPRDKLPARTTVLLLDTSDPLTAKHQEELRRLVEEIQGTHGGPSDQGPNFRVAPGDKLVVYKLPSDMAFIRDPNALQPVLEVCNPGVNPSIDWDWRDDLTGGRQLAMRNWQHFDQFVRSLFEEIQTVQEQSVSPILEALGIIVPRHAPSRRVAPSAQGRMRLVMFSDLLQHSETLSHYGSYPPADKVRETPGMRSLATKLQGVEISLFRLERDRYSRWQTAGHYHWWPRLMADFGGQVVWVEPI